MHLRRLYPVVCSSVVGTSQAPESREIHIGEREVFIGGNSSVHSSIKLGAYTAILDHLNLVGINNPSHNLTTVYLETPIVVPTQDPLEYAPLPGRLGKPSGYLLTITGFYIGGSRRRPPNPPPPPPYHTHPWMHPPTGQA